MADPEGGPGTTAADRGRERPARARRVRRVLRWLVPALALYLTAGYASTAFRVVHATTASVPASSLPSLEGTLLSGVFSVHTHRSHDARGTRDDVAEAAAAAGLDFVVIGDHPRDDRRPDWEFWDPEFREGVFLEGGLELRAPEAGKVLTLGADTTYKQWEGSFPSFERFIRRGSASAIIVHGRGPRESERWVRPTAISFEGWEVLDVSEETRHALRGIWGPYHLLTLAVGFPVGAGGPALRHAFRRGFDTPAAAAFDSLRTLAPLTATAGVNAHPKLRLGPLLLPPYRPFFETLVVHLVSEVPLPGDGRVAEEVLASSIRRGEAFLSLGRTEKARRFRMAVLRRGVEVARPGEDVPAMAGMVLRAGFEPAGEGESALPAVLYRVVRNGREMEWVEGPELEWSPPRAGYYRIEVYTYSARVGSVVFRLRPWIFTNPVGLVGPGDGSLRGRMGRVAPGE